MHLPTTPIIFVYKPSKVDRLVTTAIYSAMFIVTVVLLSRQLSPNGYQVVSLLISLVIFGPIYGSFVLGMWIEELQVGDSWLMRRNLIGKRTWVDLGELKNIQLRGTRYPRFKFRDQSGRTLSISSIDLRANPELYRAVCLAAEKAVHRKQISSLGGLTATRYLKPLSPTMVAINPND